MFRRRTPVPFKRRVRSLLWPDRGWRRGSRYVMHRISRLPGSEYSIAGGFACGAAMSFTPLVGLHFVLSALLAWVIRANPIAALLGTVVGNPWTFPFIWVWLYDFGRRLIAMTHMGTAPGAGADQVDFSALFGHATQALLNLDLGYLAKVAGPVIWPMMVAALPTAAVVWLIAYGLMWPAVRRYRLSRARRRQANDDDGSNSSGRPSGGEGSGTAALPMSKRGVS